MDISKLSNPFAPEKVHWRVGAMTKDKKKCIALAYIDARDVMDRLDDVCGPANWQCKYEHASNSGYVCSIGIRIGDEWVWKANGAGETDIEAQKGAMSDSFKRAAVLWGIGRYLYDVPNTWVALDEYKKIVPSEISRLMATLPGAVIDWAAQVPRISAAIQNATSPDKLSSLWDHPKTQNVLDHLSKDQIAKLNEERTTKLKSLTASFEKDSEAA